MDDQLEVIKKVLNDKMIKWSQPTGQIYAWLEWAIEEIERLRNINDQLMELDSELELENSRLKCSVISETMGTDD